LMKVMEMDNDIRNAVLYMIALLVLMLGSAVAMVSGLTGLGIFLLFLLVCLFAVPFVIFATAYNKYKR
jgi:hypothetical protein